MYITLKWLMLSAAIVWAGRTLPVPTLAARYRRGLLQLVRVAIILPIPFAILGIAMGWPTLTASAGLWCTGFLVILMVWGSLIGVAIDSILPGKAPDGTDQVGKGWLSFSGARYVNLARGVLLWEALTYWLLSIVPLKNNFWYVPFCALTIVCLILMAYHWKRDSKWLRPILWYSGISALALCMIKFFWPSLAFVNMQFQSKWGLFKSKGGPNTDFVWSENTLLYGILILVGVMILSIILYRLICRSIQGKNIASSSTSQSSVSHGHASGKSIWVPLACIAVVVYVVGVLIMLGREQHERRNLGKVMIVASATNLPRTDTYPITANVWTPVVIGERIDAIWHAPGKYFFRFNTEQREYEDGPDCFIKMPKRKGPYTVLFRAKEFPTTVSVYQTAMP